MTWAANVSTSNRDARGATVKHVPRRYRVPRELIEEYERERTEVILEPGDLENAKQPETVVEAAEYFLLESDTNREMWADLDASVSFELHQPRGTTVLYVVEASEDGDTVMYRSSDGRHGATTGQRIAG
jgi:hypothetical protein